MTTRGFRTALGTAVCLVLLTSGPAWAQRAPGPGAPRGPAPPPPPPPPAPPAAAAEPATPEPTAGDALARWGGLGQSTSTLSLLQAMQTTLSTHPSIASARADVAGRTALVGVARGAYDPTFTAGLSQNRDVIPVLPGQRIVPNETALITDVTSLNVGGAAATTFGMTVAPTVGLERVYQRATNGVVVPGNATQQQARVGLALRQRLLRGAGTVGTASAVEGARGAQAASVQNLSYTAQTRALDTAVAYFALVAATRNVSLLQSAESSARQTLEQTRILVESNQRPRADLHALEGRLASRTNAVVGAQNDQLQAIYSLRTAMGLNAESFEYWAPTDTLPTPRLPDGDVNALLTQARQNRTDLKAARHTIVSNAATLRGAEWNTLPELDVTGSIGYAGALEKDGVDAFFAAAGRNVAGPNAGIGLSLELPFNNTAQKAQRDFARSQYDQARIQAADIERRISLDVRSALDDLRLSAAALQTSIQAVRGYEQAVGDERDKLKAGVGTILDTLLTEDYLVQAELTQTANHLRYAAALARLRFELGTLPSEREAASRVVAELLN